ncbi:hypothetical protein TREMEDRAFT_26575 [Tremella mesenterica DSM 1558]|uniref:uncharacterized protein n=1 Tax=Tremella mesenterica (strain ATCC 24925 / CBS 8224 / DSM 1558 / NBRC 9311 / NRRL Y-6157 / RJB 2259-6 / UBC 559-6) TaxID=578456 RepID=UPI0003F49D94|nr:uncharacterized protein TREMEDRAFT_26575 [Tremella mesenterica DSM 1558]EIW72832.1 hypothetical protein TREMEDRAFT_26575 [Tremella mesenterica DSM 1558]
MSQTDYSQHLLPTALPTTPYPPRPATIQHTSGTSRVMYRHHETHAPGPLPYFLPPPGQMSHDPSLSSEPNTQAVYSTYPSRLRTGVTGLVQPEQLTGGPRERELFLAELDREISSTRPGSGASTPRYDSPTSFGKPKRPNLTGRRIRAVNYAEKASDDESSEGEDMDDFEDDSDLEDENLPRSKKRREVERQLQPNGGGDVQAAMRIARLRKKKEELDKGWTWIGDRVPGERVRSVRAKATKHQYMSEELLLREAGRPEALIPITVDLEVSSEVQDQMGIKIRDRFLWNVNEPFMTPYQFAAIFCEDVQIPVQQYATVIADLIQAQIEESQPVAEADIGNEEVTEDDVIWSDEEEGMVEDENEEEEVEKQWAEADCRVFLNLDVQIYSHLLRDRIEWDLSSTLPPSHFARAYCRDLGLTGEPVVLVTHAILEEILKHKKDALDLELFSVSHPDIQTGWERTLPLPRVNNRRGAQPLQGVWRDWWEREDFGPHLVELSFEDLEKREQERVRETRRIMRTLTSVKRRR